MATTNGIFFVDNGGISYYRDACANYAFSRSKELCVWYK